MLQACQVCGGGHLGAAGIGNPHVPVPVADPRCMRFPGTADGSGGSRTGLGAKGEENQRGLETEQQRGEPGRYSSWKEGWTRGPICNQGHEYIDKELATAISHGRGACVPRELGRVQSRQVEMEWSPGSEAGSAFQECQRSCGGAEVPWTWVHLGCLVVWSRVEMPAG